MNAAQIVERLQEMAHAAATHSAFYRDAIKAGKISERQGAIFLERFCRLDLIRTEDLTPAPKVRRKVKRA